MAKIRRVARFITVSLSGEEAKEGSEASRLSKPTLQSYQFLTREKRRKRGGMAEQDGPK
jgi:hypothetical protein